MRSMKVFSLTVISSCLLAACGGGGGSSTQVLAFKKVSSMSSSALATQLSLDPVGQMALNIAGTPKCGVDYYSYQYQTVGGQGESTTASGVIMAPTGAAGCTGARPILLYTHGTAVTKAYNLANVADPTNEAWEEGAMVAAFYAAQGYIVVGSNYAGYDVSTLPYHPYLNANQQSQDVINSLTAARTAIGSYVTSGVSDNGRLFITGYSQGGHVAMATMRAMQAAGMPVTAASPMSGPYALLALADNIVAYSSPNLGSTIYLPMVVNSYQNSYGGIYNSPSDIYSPTYASGIDTLIPGAYTFTTLYSSGKLPQLALFNSVTPGKGSEPSSGSATVDALLAQPSQASNLLGNLGFGSPYLYKNSMRIAYALDAAGPGGTPDGAFPTPSTYMPPTATPSNPLRAALKRNDLRGFSPTSPTMLCGGMNDPEVYYQDDTLVMKALWTKNPPATSVSYVDVDPSTNGNTANAGQVAYILAGIAATVVGGEAPGTAAAKISADVQSAVLAYPAFAAFFTNGVPNSPQGLMATGLASVAAQVVAADLAAKVTSPSQIANDMVLGVLSNYHYPLTQLSCEAAAQKFFAAIP